MSERKYTCGGCKGVVSPPKGARRFTLEQIKKNHQETCPSRRANG